jgi:uncharacterized protein YecT (DUF1311 family)
MPLRTLRSLLSIAFISSAHLASVAQHMNAPGVPCNVPSSTAAESAYFGKAVQTADRELNAIYTQVRSVLSSEEQKELLEAQRAWLRYRNLTCNAEYNLYGDGTGGPVTRSACLAAITHQRVA